MEVLWSYRDKFTSGRISNQHVRMSFSPEIAFTYNAKLEILCVCKNENLLAH